MTELINTEKRQLIPRWHTSRKIEFMQPLSTYETQQESEDDGLLFEIEDKKQLWKASGSLASATDLFVGLNLANMAFDPLFIETKDFLLSNQNVVSNAVNNIVTPTLKRLDSSNNYTTNKERIYEILGTLKRFARDCPYDSLTWNDLAFYYAVIGEKDKAEHCMRVAYNLQSKHPFLARSYARLLVHYDEPDKAIYILKNTGLVKNHPEILSADIAIRTSFNIGNPDVRTAKRLISRFYNRPYSISELSASIGTLEVESGSLKKAKQYLEASALMPTENTIAQLKWVSQQHNIYIDIKHDTVKSIEADAIAAYNRKDYLNSREKLMTLHRFQPFSEGALIDAGYLSLVALDEPEFLYTFSEYFGYETLESFAAKNNYIVAKMLINDLDGVDVMMKELAILADSDREKAVLSAAIGMYLYCIGEFDSARENYEKTNAYFRSKKDSFNLSLSLLHQGLMEKLIDLEKAKAMFEKAKKEAKKVSKSPEISERIQRELDSINIKK